MADRDKQAIALEGVSFDWPGRRFGLSIDSFSVSSGESVLLLGESGSGKSTLLSLICGIVLAEAGRVEITGQDLGKLTGRARDRFRADNFGIIFQVFNLLQYATALDNILIPLRFSPTRKASCSDPRAEALRLTSALGLPDALIENGAASTLSVGQQQRVAVARAMIGSPPIVVADEPTSALDAGRQAEFLDLVFRQVAEAGATFLMVSHDPRVGDRFDRVIDLRDIARVHSGAPT